VLKGNADRFLIIRRASLFSGTFGPTKTREVKKGANDMVSEKGEKGKKRKSCLWGIWGGVSKVRCRRMGGNREKLFGSRSTNGRRWIMGGDYKKKQGGRQSIGGKAPVPRRGCEDQRGGGKNEAEKMGDEGEGRKC